jgi:hypothetical protein
MFCLHKKREQFRGSLLYIIAFSRDNEYFKVISKISYVNQKIEVKTPMLQFYVKNITRHCTSSFNESSVYNKILVIALVKITI